MSTAVMSPVELLKYRTLLTTIIESFFCDFIKVLPAFIFQSSVPSLTEIHLKILLKSMIKNLSLYVFICE